MHSYFKIAILFSLPVLGFLFGYIKGRYSRRRAENCGEALVRQSLAKYCENRDAHVLNNVTLRLDDGSTTQVDHVLISTKGVFVIETKHYRGWIFASPKFKVWTQCTYAGKYTFQNPMYQNYKHVKAIQSLFEFLEPTIIHNMVVFSGNAVFKTVKPDNVHHIDELIPSIEKYRDGTLSLNRVQFCIGRLEYMRLEVTRKTDIEHQQYLTQRFGI
ncbi:MAG: nuclease-related domain-containing protein [Gammaproteobacteria bacterium]